MECSRAQRPLLAPAYSCSVPQHQQRALRASQQPHGALHLVRHGIVPWEHRRLKGGESRAGHVQLP